MPFYNKLWVVDAFTEFIISNVCSTSGVTCYQGIVVHIGLFLFVSPTCIQDLYRTEEKAKSG